MADDVHQTMVTETEQAGFWKPRHAVYGAGLLLLVVLLVRACSGDSEVEKPEAETRKAEPVPAAVDRVPASRQWPGQYPSARQQQPVQQQPVYRYADPRQPPVQQAGRLPATDPGNPWSVRRQQAVTGTGSGYVAPSYSQQYEQEVPWGQTQQQRPTYSQQPGSAQYRPLDEEPRQQGRTTLPVLPVPVVPVPAPAAVWPPAAAPYDRPAGSSYGQSGAQQSYPYPGGYPGYYGGSVYGVPGAYGGRLPGYPGYGAPWY